MDSGVFKIFITSRTYVIRLIVHSFMIISSACAGNHPVDEYFDQDYYFFDGSVQIQGRAEMPPVEQETMGLPIRFLNLGERRDLCIEEAKKNAHSKWLALTSGESLSQYEWYKKIREKRIKSSLKSCLTGSYIRQRFYDDIRTCRVVMIYPCRPQDY